MKSNVDNEEDINNVGKNKKINDAKLGNAIFGEEDEHPGNQERVHQCEQQGHRRPDNSNFFIFHYFFIDFYFQK